MKKILFIFLLLAGMNTFANDLAAGLVIGMASGSSMSKFNFRQQTTMQYRLNDGSILIWSEYMPNTIFKYYDGKEEIFICRHSKKLFSQVANVNLISVVAGKKEYIVFSFDEDGIQVGKEFVSEKPKTYRASRAFFISLIVIGIIGLLVFIAFIVYRNEDEKEDDDGDEEE